MHLFFFSIFVIVIIEMFPHYCSAVFAYTLFQGVPDILKYGLCPAMLTPSKPCELDLSLSIYIDLQSCGIWWCHRFKLTSLLYNFGCFFYFLSVTRRCFPALGQKGGVITVGNNSHFDDGSGKMRDAKDLMDGVKWVYIRVNTLLSLLVKNRGPATFRFY